MSVDSEGRIETVMVRDPPVAHLHESLARALSRVRAEAKAALAVVDGDRIAAVLSAKILEESCAAASDPQAVYLRDHFGPPVPFCHPEDRVATARSAFTVAAAKGARGGAIAVVDDRRRLVGAVTAEALGDAPPGGPPRSPMDPTDTSAMRNPGLTVYAPWAALDG